MASKTIPEGFHSVTPFLMLSDPRREIDFLKAAFGAVENSYHDLGGGHVHAEVTIGDSRIMMGKTETTPAFLYVYVPDCDRVYQRALSAGGRSVEEPADKPWGDRCATVKDPFGNTWYIATFREQVSEEEMRRRFAAAEH